MLRWILVVFWSLLTLWMFTYSMYISFVYSLLMLWCFIPNEKHRVGKLIAILGFSPLVMWNVGLVEYGLKTIDIHCRVLGYTGHNKAGFCSYSADSYRIGQRHTDGPLLNTMEKLGVHGFNIILATGGTLAGLPEVGWETLYLSFAKDPVNTGMVNEPKSIRIQQCQSQTQLQKKSTSRGKGDWMFTSSTIRKIVAKNVSKAKTVTTANPMKFEPQKVHFPGVGSSNNAYYGSLSHSDNLRVPLALFVPDGMLHQESRMTQKGAIIDVTWKGTISYPANASFLFKIPTIYQLPVLSELTGQTKGFPLLLSEGIFCGMAVDGAMNPYTQIWTTTVSVQDLRLTSKGKLGSKRGWIEALLRPLLK